jgi:hypothetical protein
VTRIERLVVQQMVAVTHFSDNLVLAHCLVMLTRTMKEGIIGFFLMKRSSLIVPVLEGKERMPKRATQVILSEKEREALVLQAWASSE